MEYFVYLLYSLKQNSYYIGQTNNLKKRLIRHNKGNVLSTKNGLPWMLIKFESYPNRNEARWREFCLKKNAYLRKKFYGE